jgi:hypothetical protein
MAGGAVRSFPVRDTGAEAMMVAHVVPIRLSARDIFVRCAAALILTHVTAPQAPPVELVQSLFDLTPAEARVARSLASGKTVEDIATDGGISRKEGNFMSIAPEAFTTAKRTEHLALGLSLHKHTRNPTNCS